MNPNGDGVSLKQNLVVLVRENFTELILVIINLNEMESKNIKINVFCNFKTIASNELAMGNSLFSYHLRKFNFGVWVWVGFGSELFFSESLLQMMGIPEEIIPTLELVIDCIHPDDQEKFLNYLERLLDEEGPENFSFRVWLPNNTERTILCQVGRLLTMDKEAYDVIGVCWEEN
jgi:PAS domain-containing protein